MIEAPRRRFSEDLWSENKDLTETVDDLRFLINVSNFLILTFRKIISEQSQLLGQQSIIIEEHKCSNGWDEEQVQEEDK